VIPIVVTPGLDLIKPTGDTGYSTHIESLIGKDSPMGKLVGGGAGQTLTTKEKEFLSKSNSNCWWVSSYRWWNCCCSSSR